FWAAFQFSARPFAQLIYSRSNLLEKRPGYPLALIQKRGKKMFVGNVRVISLRSQILRSLQRLLHLLGVFIDAHVRKDSERNPQRQSRAIVIPSEARNLAIGAWITRVYMCAQRFLGRSFARSG